MFATQFFNPYFRTSLRDKTRLAPLGAVLAVGSFYLSMMIVTHRVRSAERVVTPFVLRQELSTFESTTKGEIINRRIIARRSDGSTVLLENILGRQGFRLGKTARKITFADGRVVTLVDWLRAKVTWPTTTTQLAHYLERIMYPPSNCAPPGDSFLSSGSVLDHPALLVRPVHVEGHEITAWRAPDLGCESLQYRIEGKEADGPPKLEVEARAISLELREPDAALFDEGADYAERSPSEILQMELAAIGAPFDDQAKRWGKREDDVYYGGRR